MYRDQYEADARYIEERYPVDEDKQILEEIMVDGGIDLKKVKEYMERQYEAIAHADAEHKRFFEEVESARERGYSHQQIWGQRDHVSFPEMLYHKIGVAKENIRNCRRICGKNNIFIEVERWTQTHYDIDVYEGEW